MTDRERWAVYPLLFLTLGIAMKDKLFREVEIERVQCSRLVCQALLVTDPQGKQQVVVSSNAEGGFVRALGNENNPTVYLGNDGRVAGLLFLDRQGGVRVNRGSIITLPDDGPPDNPPADDPPPEDSPAEVPPPDAKS